ncbi:MAG: ABC transporter ATP-binding protein [Sneathiellaceae bacterium]
MAEDLLQIRDLRKSFGGIAVTAGVSLSVRRGETHALIGPNGAGKTTLIAQLSGDLRPDAGQVLWYGRDVTRLPPYRRSRLGMARSFQITSVFMDLTVLDNVALAVQARAGHSFRFWAPARRDGRLTEPAMAVLAQVGLAGRAGQPASILSHGERRALEIAMALATEPELLLLDEPMAGMGPEESSEMIATLRGLKSHKTILLVEHDMDAVFALADRISVLVYGKIIAAGTPEEIRNDAHVRRAYLGEEAA